MSIEEQVKPLVSPALRRAVRENKRLRYEVQVATRQVPHLRTMIESCPDGLALLRGNASIVEHNKAMAHLLSDGEAFLVDRSFVQLVSAKLGPQGESDAWGEEVLSLALQRPQTLQVVLGELDVELRISGWVEDEDAFYMVSARPIATEASQERELAKARRHIRALDRELEEQRRLDEAARLEALSVLSSSLVHDLNNALSVVCMSIELLEEDLGPGSHEELLADALAGTGYVRELVSRLKGFSKGNRLTVRPLCLTTWLPTFLRPVAAGHRAELHVHTGLEKLWVAADEHQLAQVFLNLVTNAIQASQELGHGPVVTVHLEASPHGYLGGQVVRPVSEAAAPHVLVSVVDNGPGIAPEMLGRLFTPFLTSKHQGSGLGLASSARIVALHGGGIAVDNLPDEGARFVVALPLTDTCSSAQVRERDA